MAVTVRFYSYAKRENSTAQPGVGDSYTDLSCELKNECYVRTPVILVNPPTGFTPYSYNYAYIATFGRYYFIRDWQWLNGIWEAAMFCDVLATFKTQIGLASEYVLRSASNGNGNVIDTMYPMTDVITTSSKAIASGDVNYTVSNGFYVVGVISPSGSVAGAVAYYVMTYTEFNSFKQMLLSSISWTNVQASEISEDMLKTIFNPFQYIVSCRWFPTIPNSNVTTVSQIQFGWWTFNTSAKIYSSSISFENYNFSLAFNDIPKHPKAATRGSYLNQRPFTEYYLQMAPYGIVELPNSIVSNSGGLNFINTVDFFTGDSTLTILQDSNKAPVLTVKGKTGVDIQLAQVASNAVAGLNAVGQGINAAGNSLFSGNIVGAVMNSISAVASAVEQAAPTVQTGGGTGSFSDIGRFAGKCYLLCKFHDVADEDVAQLGRPLCQQKQISTLSGYILCAHGDIGISGNQEEQRQIREFMETGFFYE